MVVIPIVLFPQAYLAIRKYVNDNNNYLIFLSRMVLPLLELNTWFSELDQRYQKKQKKAKCITPSKRRKVGLPAKSSPPAGAPSWAINPEWKSGIAVNHSFCWCTHHLHFL